MKSNIKVNMNIENIEKAISCGWESLCFETSDEDFFMSVRRDNRMFEIIVDGENKVFRNGVKLTSAEIYDFVVKNLSLYDNQDIVIESNNWFSVLEYSIVDGVNGEEMHVIEDYILEVNATSIGELSEHLISYLDGGSNET